MAFLSDEKKLGKFLLDSPPGEVNDVFNGMYTNVFEPSLIGNDDGLKYFNHINQFLIVGLWTNPVVFQEGVLTALEQYNTEQFVTVTPPGQEHNVR